MHESEYNKIIFLKQKIACTFVSIHTRMHEKERAYFYKNDISVVSSNSIKSYASMLRIKTHVKYIF